MSWNTRELLDRCLASLRPASEAGLATVWVVDNKSTDGSAEMVAERHPWVSLVASEDNLGYGPAVNLVAERTSTEFVVASNSDILVRPGALERLVDAAEEDPGAGIFAPRLVLPDGTTQHSVWPFPTASVHIAANLAPHLVPRRIGDRLALFGMWDSTRPRRVPWAIGAFVLVRRSTWDAIGGFATDQWMSAEDVDLGWRARAAGWATRYVPDAVIDHEESASVGQRWGIDLPIHWQRCSYSWMERRIGRRRAVVVGLINLAGALARVPLFELRALLKRGAWADRARGHRRWTLVHFYAFAPRRVLDRYR